MESLQKIRFVLKNAESMHKCGRPVLVNRNVTPIHWNYVNRVTLIQRDIPTIKVLLLSLLSKNQLPLHQDFEMLH